MTSKTFIPPRYTPALGARETERAIMKIKNSFQRNLAFELDLDRVTAPLFVEAGTGINDDLNGVEKPVAFNVKDMGGQRAEIVQSLAKWKRMALAELEIPPGRGLYTDMNAIRPHEELDNVHSLYVDQWDWERVITEEERNLDFLKWIVCKIYDVIRRTEKYICHEYEDLQPLLPEEIVFKHAEELEAEYPDLTPKEREREACRLHRAVFVIGIGAPLAGGDPHDGRAPDYDDWSTVTREGYKGLNGDILVYNDILDTAFELSSMGIRVNRQVLADQLKLAGAEERAELYFHRSLLDGKLPLSVGGGIGQSRLCMLYLQKAHIGEIQASMWPEEMRRECQDNGIFLL
ncbi:MAG: aspartate--ammonia ligase [Verrucomicrobiota bacterium]